MFNFIGFVFSLLNGIYITCNLNLKFYILKTLTILYAMFNFIAFIFSLLNRIYITCAIHTQVKRQASVVRILSSGFFGIFTTSINKKLLDARIKEYNTKISKILFFSPWWAGKLDPFTAQVPSQPNSKSQMPSSHFLLSRHMNHIIITHHPTWTLMLTQTSQYLPIQTISQFDNSDLETPDSQIRRFRNQPVNIFSSPFRPIHSQAQTESPSIY